MYEPFYIQQFATGLEKDKAEFQVLDDAFVTLNDVYVWRGRVKRKAGSKTVCRLTRIRTGQALGNTIGADHTGNIRIALMLEANGEITQGSITISVAAPNAETFTEPAIPDGTLVGSGGGTGTINYATMAYQIISGAGWGAGQAITITFAYYPALPCMGLRIRDVSAINAEETVAFDTKYVYFWNNATARFEENASGVAWNGTDSDFFWTVNYYSGAASGDIFFVTNFNRGATPDVMRYYSTTTGTWTSFLPSIDGAGNELHQARLILPYKGRLLAFNVYEGANLAAAAHLPRRVRWSQNGDPLEVNAWRVDIAGKGGYLDAPTSEYIISVAYIRDTLIVGFEKSIWKLRYTGNVILPFVWEQIDSEFGVESTFSVIRADDSQITVGATGIVGCDGVNAQRIDDKIPDEVFSVHNQGNGLERVHGIRDYDKKLFYWTMPAATPDATYPNKVLVYNYDNGSWAYFKDSFTCFGYLQTITDKRWMDFPTTPWTEANFTWASNALQALYPDIIAGNQQGYVVKVQSKLSHNDPSFAITAITPGDPVILTVPNHNMTSGDIIYVRNILGTASVLNYVNPYSTYKTGIFRVGVITSDTIMLQDIDNLPVSMPVGTYLGGGEIGWTHDFRAKSKKFNIVDTGKSAEFGYMDFLVDTTLFGQFNVDFYVDHNDHYPMNNPTDTHDEFFNTTVSTVEYASDVYSQSKVIHRMYTHFRVQFLQFELNLTNAQKFDEYVQDSDIQLYAMILWLDKSGRLV